MSTDISGVTSTYYSQLISSSDSSDSTDSTSTVDDLTNSFLTLLTAQMEYQDPLDPMDNTEYTSMLAQLTSVQYLSDLSAKMDYEQLYLASINNSLTTGMIGKEVTASGNSITFDGTTSPTISYDLDTAAATVYVNIYDDSGSLVRTISCGSQSAGEQELTWDGYDKNGDKADEGTYTFKVLATDTDGNSVDVTTEITGIVDSIYFEEGVGYATINGQKIAISEIITIGTPPDSDSE